MNKHEKQTLPPQTVSQSGNISNNELPKSTASGMIPIRLTNDYIFHEIFRRSKSALQGFLCSLLRLKPEEIHSIEFENPVLSGSTPKDKTVVLDTCLKLNNHTRINLEMQVKNQYNWPERSFIYISRMAGDIEAGSPYQTLSKIIHIGIHDFSMFKDEKEFYATYQFANIKNFRIYSDKIIISVLNLTQISNATEEDKAYKLDLWASAFKASTWEELLMLAKKDDAINDLVVTYKKLTAAEIERWIAFAEEDRIRTENGFLYEIQKRDEAIKFNDIG